MKRLTFLALLIFSALTSFGQLNCICGNDGELDAGAGYLTYNWSNGATTQTVDIDPMCPSDSGNYSVTVTDACGTTSTNYSVSICTAGNVGINTAFYTGSAQLCLLIATPPTCCENPSYEWLDPCGSIVSTQNTMASAFGRNEITVCGVYTLNMVSCNGCTECASSTTINIQNGPGVPACCSGMCGCVGCTANITAWSSSVQCNQPATYAATSCTGATLSWDVTLGGSTVSSGTGTPFTFTPTQNGFHTITLTVLDDCGNTTTDVRTTNVTGCTACDDCSSATISASNTPSCNNSTVFSFTCASATNISWSVTGGGGTISGNTLTYTPTANGTYTVSVQFTDGCGNTVTDQIQFTVNDCVTCQDCTGSSISANNTPSCLNPTTFSISCSQTTTFNWSVTGGGGTSNGDQFTYTPNSNGSYVVTVQFVDGCGNNITRTFSFTINGCTICDCVPQITYNAANCEIDYVVSGCTNWQLRFSNSSNCTGTSTVASGTGNVNFSYDICNGMGDGFYEIVALETGCPFQQTSCLATSCCCPTPSFAFSQTGFPWSFGVVTCGSNYDGNFTMDYSCDNFLVQEDFTITSTENMTWAISSATCSAFTTSPIVSSSPTSITITPTEVGTLCGTPPSGCTTNGGAYEGYIILTATNSCNQTFDLIIHMLSC